MGNLNGLGFIHLELTSRCNKNPGCWMCGRRRIEKEYPHLVDWGDMPEEMVYEISKQISKGIVCQFHNNGEPLLYPHLDFALSCFRENIRCFNTNGKLLGERAEQIIGNLEVLTISVIENDPEAGKQYETVKQFIERKGTRKPILIYRLLGNVDHKERWEELPGICASRILHAAEGSRDYQKPVTIPEIGICLDLLTHLAIDRFGKVSHCVRFDPHGLGVLGHISEGLENIWNGNLRKVIIQKHLRGERDRVGLCQSCEYWGVPTSP